MTEETQQDALQTAPAGAGTAIYDGLTLGQLAATIRQSGCFGNDCNQYEVAVKIMAGRDLGLGPVESMRGLHVFDGKIELGSAVMASKIKGSGAYDYEVVKHDDDGCSIDCWEKSPRTGEWKQVPSISFTREEATRAGLLNKAVWKNYFSDMCFSRCMSRFFRRYCPHLAGGAVYGDGEVSDAPERPPSGGGRTNPPAPEQRVEEAGEAPTVDPTTPAESSTKSGEPISEASSDPAPIGTSAPEQRPEEIWPNPDSEAARAEAEAGKVDPIISPRSEPDPAGSTTAIGDGETVDPTRATPNSSTPPVESQPTTDTPTPTLPASESSEPDEHPFTRFCKQVTELKEALDETDGNPDRYYAVYAARGLENRLSVGKGDSKLQREILLELHDALKEAVSEKAEREATAELERQRDERDTKIFTGGATDCGEPDEDDIALAEGIAYVEKVERQEEALSQPANASMEPNDEPPATEPDLFSD